VDWKSWRNSYSCRCFCSADVSFPKPRQFSFNFDRVEKMSHGVHAFIVPIRDSKSLKPFHGVIVGDMGRKIGLNGLDNGFVAFEQYPIPKENLLNKVIIISFHCD
jgi:hypothetical protein